MQYTPEQKKYIMAKVKGMTFSQIPESLKIFWIEYKLKNN